MVPDRNGGPCRGNPFAVRDYDMRQGLLSHFAGCSSGFRYSGAISQDEEQIWDRKMMFALGYELPDPPAPGISQFIYVGDPAKRTDYHPADEQPRNLLRS